MTYLFLAILLAAIQILLFRNTLDLGTNAVIFAANILFFLTGVTVYKKSSFTKFTLYLFGYLLLFIFVFLLKNSPLLFTLFIIMFSAFFPATRLLVYLLIFIFSVVFITPYWLQVFLTLAFYYTIAVAIYKKTFSKFMTGMFTVGFLFLFFIIFPILYFSLQITPQTLIAVFKNNEFIRALMNSLITSAISTLIILILGTPFAYVMARADFKGKNFLDNLIDLPILIPQTVAGIALLVLLGPKSPLGEFMYKNCRIAITNGYLGIVAAQVFVSSPFFIRSAINAFEGVDQRLEDTSRTLGASPLGTFMRISLPLAGSGIFNGCILSWARALSEVGSVMVIAYHPMTAPVFLYDQFVQYGLSETQPAAILLVITCLWAFISLRWFRYQMARKIGR